MKRIGKLLLSLSMVLCLLAVPFAVSAQGEVFDLMPTADDGYTIVEGDGTVTVADGTLTLVNNGDGDLRVTIDNTTPFDLSALNTLHMQFNAEMPFKMAYHIISDADSSNDWLATTVDFADVYEVDFEADRSPAGEYDVNMAVSALAVGVTDQSSVHYDQFIILVTGKGTFTLNTVEMIAVESDAPVEDEPAADDDTTTTAQAEEDAVTTTTASTAEKSDAKDDQTETSILLPILLVVVVVIVCVVVIVIIKRRKA